MKWNSLLLAAVFWSGAACGEDATADLLRTAPRGAPLAPSAASAPRAITTGTIYLSADETRRLVGAARGATVRLDSVERQLGTAGTALEFARIELFAASARVQRATRAGGSLIDPPRRHYFLATTPSEAAGIALDPVSGALSGFAVRGESRVNLSGSASGGIVVTALTAEPDQVNECSTVMGDQPESVRIALATEDFASLSEAPQGTALSWQAVIAIDTDTEWMAGKGNNTTTALNWITDLFLAMNVFYERDVETRLLIGDVLLRIGSDPYSVPSNRIDQLNEFAAYWRVNMSAIDRDFAALLSGRGIAATAYSGIAWVNQYCQKGSVSGLNTVGSYSLNAIGSSRTPANTAQFVGHELGHNLGSPHTHCYNQPVDQCYNAEPGCYSGTPVCPAGGKGTIMSYCHYPAPNGANCTTNLLEFHPTVQSFLENRLAQNSPGCIAPYNGPVDELIMQDGFENP